MRISKKTILSILIIITTLIAIALDVRDVKMNNVVKNPILVEQCIDFSEIKISPEKNLNVKQLINVLISQMGVNVKVKSLNLKDDILYVNFDKEGYPFVQLDKTKLQSRSFNTEGELQAYILSSIYETVYQNFGYKTRFTKEGKDERILIGMIGKDYSFSPAEPFIEEEQNKDRVVYALYNRDGSYEYQYDNNVSYLPLDEFLSRIADRLGEKILINDIYEEGNNIYIDFNKEGAPFCQNEYFKGVEQDKDFKTALETREYRTLNSLAKSYKLNYGVEEVYFLMDGDSLQLGNVMFSDKYPWKER